MSTTLAPDLIYRVITDYEALVDAFADRVEELNTPLTEIDAASGMTRGNMQRLLRSADPKDWRPSNKRKQSRAFGWETLGNALEGTGMVMVLMIDDARFAAIKQQLPKRKRKDLPRIVGKRRPAWLLTPKKASKLREKWWSSLTPAQQKKHQRKAQRGMVAARRRKKKQHGIQKTPQARSVAVHAQDRQEGWAQAHGAVEQGTALETSS